MKLFFLAGLCVTDPWMVVASVMYSTGINVLLLKSPKPGPETLFQFPSGPPSQTVPDTETA
jgi:hypothetical protein